jgi:hypothetical protein
MATGGGTAPVQPEHSRDREKDVIIEPDISNTKNSGRTIMLGSFKVIDMFSN